VICIFLIRDGVFSGMGYLSGVTVVDLPGLDLLDLS